MKEKIEEFLENVKVRNSEGTYKYYCCHLKAISLACKILNLDLFKDFVNLSKVNHFIIYEKQNSVSNSTINKRLKIIVYINKFFDNEIHIDLLKVNKKNFDFIDECNLAKILIYVDNLVNTNFNLNFKLAINILIHTGVRASELINIEKQNIFLNENCILLTKTKTSEERLIFFKDNVKDLIMQNLNLNNPSKFLFWNWNKNREFKNNDLEYVIRLLKKHCEINKLHPHMFRHTFASLMVKNGCPIFPLMKLLGHKSVKTTEIYVHQDINSIKNAFDKFFDLN